LQKEKLIRYQKSIIKKQKGGMKKMVMRKLLRNKIQTLYRTQDRCAYELGIDAGILSRIINCTKDPTEEQLVELCNYLNMTAEEVNTKDE
jgi:hypothetical protein